MDTVSATGSGAIAIFGGSGATGKALISHALGKGLHVRALARKASSLDPARPRLDVLEGSLSSEDVLSTLRGCGAAICVFGPHPPYIDVFCADATATIIAAMQELGMRRLVCQTGAMIGTYPSNRSRPFQFMADMFKRRSPQAASDREGQEDVVLHSGLDWTIVKPPRLCDDRAKGGWSAGPDIRVGLLSSITRDDLAEFLLAETLLSEHIGQAVFIRN